MSGRGGGGGNPKNCPQCGKPGSGNFCHHCGAALGGRFCNKCGAALSAAATFCNQCGAKAAGSGGGAPVSHRAAAVATVGGGNAPWWIAGGAMFVLILVVGWTMVRPAGPAAPAGAPAGMGGGVDPNAPGTTDISQMSPREAADRLFDRVMRTVSAGDTAGALGFQPMAVQAFQLAEPLDLDGMFHMALLQELSDPAAALATALRMMETEPDHVLALGVAGQAEAQLGNLAAAKAYFEKLRSVYDVQFARSLPEYEAHANVMASMKAAADSFVAAH